MLHKCPPGVNSGNIISKVIVKRMIIKSSFSSDIKHKKGLPGPFSKKYNSGKTFYCLLDKTVCGKKHVIISEIREINNTCFMLCFIK